MQRQQQPPPWDDERAVEKLAESDLVSAPIEAMKARVQAESKTVGVVVGISPALASRRSRPRKLSSRRKTEEFDLAGCERDVIEAFDERGDIVPLIKLISWLPPKDTARLSPATLRLIVELLLENLPKASKLPRGRGRPRATESESKHRKKYKVHDAADEVGLIILILARLYPERSPAEARRRAIEVAATRHGIDSETLLRHVNRARKDRHRIFTVR